MKLKISLLLSFLLTACAVGPDYTPPKITVPAKYKEAPKGWKLAKPNDHCNRGEWWKVFNEPKLNNLEKQLNCNNQNIALAVAQYHQALAIVNQQVAGFFPVITAQLDATRQKIQTASFSSTSNISSTSTANLSSSALSSRIIHTHNLGLFAAWEPDFWGGVRRGVEASVDTAQASAAQLAVTKLLMQATLAQFYFQIRTTDLNQNVLDETVSAYQKAFTISNNRYNSGVAAKADVVQAQSLLQVAQAQSINNGIVRAQYEHAIAVLIGVPASCFALPKNPLNNSPPKTPLEVPCVLLERRPDIANAERLMAAANAQIGVAIAAYFPVTTLTASGSSQGLGPWFSPSALGWAIGANIVQTVFDGGFRVAVTEAARANYNATVATYRQTVLAAFQDVEDNLSTLRILQKETIVQKRAVASAKQAVKFVLNQYKSGTTDFAAVIVAETVLYNAEKNAADIQGQSMVAAVGLIKALGGGWNGDLTLSHCK